MWCDFLSGFLNNKIPLYIAFFFLFIQSNIKIECAEISIKVKHGFDSLYRPGKWAPIIIEMDNSGKSQTSGSPSEREIVGNFILEGKNENDEEVIYSRNFELPYFSKKRFFLYAKLCEEFPEGTLIIQGKNRKKLSTIPLKFNPIDSAKSIILIVTDEASFTLPPLIAKNIFEIVTIPPEELPDSIIGLECVNLIVFPSLPSRFLNEDQRIALIQWLKNGGNIICLGGANYQSYQQSFFSIYLPAIPTSIRSFSIVNQELISDAGEKTQTTENNKDDKILINETRRNGGQILSSISDIPILFIKNIGTGKVYFWASDSSSFYGNKKIFFQKVWNGIFPFQVINKKGEIFWNNFINSFDLGLGGAAKPPSLLFIAVLFIAYVLIVGPMNFFVLKRKKRLELAWLTIPLIIIFFTLVTYWFGYISKGRNFLYWELNRMTIPLESDVARNDSIIGIFSPRNLVFSMEIPKNNSFISDFLKWESNLSSLLRPQTFRSPIAFSSQFSRKRSKNIFSLIPSPTPEFYDDNGRMRLINGSIDQWSIKFFQTDYISEINGEFDGYVNYIDGTLSGEISNYSQLIIYDSYILIGNYPIFLGTINPKEKKQFFFNQWDRFDGYNTLATHQEKAVSQIPEWSDFSNRKKEISFRSAVLQNLLLKEGVWRTFNDVKQRIMLVGWIPGTPAKANFSVGSQISTSHTFVQIPIKWQKITGPFYFSRDQLCIDFISMEGDHNEFLEDGSLSLSAPSDVYIMVHPPFDSAQISASGLSVKCSLVNPPAQKIEFLIYNLKKGSWDRVENYSLGTNFSPAGDYVSTINGRVFFRLRCGADQNPGTFSWGVIRLNDFAVSIAGTAVGGE